MRSFAELVHPYGVEEFLGTVWGRRLEVCAGDADRAATLLPWSGLNEILRRHRLESPRLRLAHDGGRVEVEQYTTAVSPRRGPAYRRLDHSKLAERLRDGATLVLDSIDELCGPIDDLAADLERVLRERVQVNCYVGFGATRGFDTHWDDHDVLVVQVHGRKHWRVFGPTRPHPTRRDVEHPDPPTGPPAHDFTLNAGEVLHVPRGWWHDANALDVPSVHLTFGVTSATGIDFVNWLADVLHRHEVARQDLPRHAGSELRRSRVKELAELLTQELDQPDVLDRFFFERDANTAPRGWGGLPWSVADDVPPSAEVRLVVPRAVLSERDGVVELAADGRRFSFAAPAAPVLQALLPGSPRSVADLAIESGLPESTVRTLCTELLRLGIATAA